MPSTSNSQKISLFSDIHFVLEMKEHKVVMPDWKLMIDENDFFM